MNSSVEATNMNYWEVPSYQSTSAYDPGVFHDSLYTRSQYDIMQILIKVVGRKDPQVQIGPVDMSCPILVCDLQDKDQRIIYASDAIYQLTGYTPAEVTGRNCRFLQSPTGKVKSKPTRDQVLEKSCRRMRKSIENRTELQIKVVNFKKDGTRFLNLLTMIPVCCDNRHYGVGFLCEVDS